jgi:predicted enzyme related to lactoylglutathione lyase
MPNQTGRFVWHDLMTTDTEGAKKFYSKVAGLGHASVGRTESVHALDNRRRTHWWSDRNQ